jgi:protein O-GlcNAc transferase
MLRDLYRQQRESLKAASAARLRHRESELRERIATGTAEPVDFIALAKVLEELFEYDAALGLLKNARENSCSLDLCIAYIDALAKRNRTEDAIAAASEAMHLFPGDLYLRIAEALTLPVVYDTSVQLEYYRSRFAQGLKALDSGLMLDTPEQRENALSALNRHVNFYLAYQMNDDRGLQETYAGLVRRILTASYPELMSFPAPPSTCDGRIRIGYISPNLHKHSISRTYAGWILGQDRRKFETFVYHIRGSVEPAREDIRGGCDHFREMSGGVLSVSREIRRDCLHASIFLDVGMHPMMTQLASVQLAPIQCAAWGHPVTTGSASVDFFLSGALLEPDDGERHYTERLIHLPGVGVCYPKPVIPRAILDAGRGRFGIRDDAIVYICSQSAFKYLPEYDDLLVRIAARVPASQFVFVTLNPAVAAALRNRLDRVFAGARLEARDYCVLLPFLELSEYLALNLASDIYLDSLEFSGFNMAMDAIASGLPVVTLPGRLMKGRLASAALTQLGVLETIARDKEDYVDIAVRLGIDRDWREHLIRKMAERESSLFSDTKSVVALEEFLSAAVSECNCR